MTYGAKAHEMNSTNYNNEVTSLIKEMAGSLSDLNAELNNPPKVDKRSDLFYESDNEIYSKG